MKPEILKIKGFGPYIEEQVIDFNKIKDNIFLISGPTGSGKTTIFDAICFALYGEASGEDRGKNIRSDFVAEDFETFVEFTFKIKEKLYKIFRSPRFERKKQRGDGTTVQDEKAVLYEFKDGKFEYVCEKLTVVKEKINDIIKLDVNQFRKIIMIPQGEFKKLITAGSDERESILKNLFDTSIYENFKKILKEKNDAVKEQLVFLNSKKEHIFSDLNLDGEVSSVISTIDDIVKQKKEDIKLKSDLVENLKIEIEKKEKDLTEVKKDNEKIEDTKKQKDILERLKSKEEFYKKEKKKLVDAENAAFIKPYEELYKNNFEKLKNKENELKNKKEDLDNNKKDFDSKKENFDNIKKEYDNLFEYKKQRDDLIEKLKKIESVDLLKKELNDLEKEFEKVKLNKKNCEDDINKVNNEVKEKSNFITQNDSVLEKNFKLKEKINSYDEKIKDLKKLILLYSELENIEKDYNEKSKYKTKGEEEFKGLQESKNSLEERYFKSQAYVMSKTLEEGKPCPVCGATHHPSLPEKQDDFVEKEEIEKIKEKIKKAEKLLKQLADDFEVVRESFRTKKSEIKFLIDSISLEEEADLKEEVLKFESEKEIFLKEKEKYDNILKTIENYKKDIADYEKQKLELEEKLKGMVKLFDEVNTKYISKTSIYDEKKVEIEGDNKKLIDEELKKLCKKIEFTEKQYDSLSKEIRDLEIKKGKLETTVEEMKKNKESLEEEEENSYKNLLDNMKLKGFNSYEIYKSSLMNEKDMKILKDDIQKFEGDLKKQESIYDEKFEKSKDLIFKSTDILEYEIKEMVSKREDLMKEINSLEIKIENLILKKDELKEIDSRMSDLSKIYSELNDLYEISIGKNSLRISLEKYVLSYYFDEILNYSNMRLEKFTEKRYSLHRSKESFDGRKNAGLDISVFDKYTGKEREAKSLSGGEIFIASLSLALGLSDVVQKNSGGVSLDTILIDEGFGSLDTNALDNAVEILMELQTSGRLIGIISHVSELKERIPDKIEIQKTKNGSYVKMEASNE